MSPPQVATNEITITEALAEIKTIQSRLTKKRQACTKYAARDSLLVDPLTEGSEEYVKREKQSILDLERRIVTIRSKIQDANLNHSLTVDSTENTVSEWLNWRREIAEHRRQFLNGILTNIERMRQEAVSRGRTTGSERGITVNLDESALQREAEQLEQTLGNLDGKLSLFNATVRINV